MTDDNYDFKLVELEGGGDYVACDSCACRAPIAWFRWEQLADRSHDTHKRALCEFCATSYCGNITGCYVPGDMHQYLRREMWIGMATVANYLKHGLR